MNTAEIVKRQRRSVTYTLPQPEYETKHVGGVNAIDVGDKDVLYSGGRDGTVRAWDLSGGMPSCTRTFEGHAGWVNDVARVTQTHLASASSDHTVRLWNLEDASSSSLTLQGHSDYVMALAQGTRGNHTKFVSGGLNCEIFLWDIERCLAINAAPSYLSSKHDGCVTPLSGSKESIYALGMDGSGNTLVSGGTELALRVWDTRSAQKEGKLKGHTDNVRAIVVDADGRKCVTGSSDRTIRVWDIGEQRCVQTFAGMHTGSIWALAVSEDFSRVYSGGIDARICVTSLADRKSSLLATESAAVLRLRLDDSHRCQSSDGDLWTATASRSIKRWPVDIPTEDVVVEEPATPPRSGSFTRRSSAHSPLPGSVTRQAGKWFEVGSPGMLTFGTPRKFDSWHDQVADGGTQQASSHHIAPSMEIPGASPIVRYGVLHDKQHVLAQNSLGTISLWHVASAKPVRTFDGMADGSDFETLLESDTLNPETTVPSWFGVDARSGSLAITLTPSSAFQAEAYAQNLGVQEAPVDERRNLGIEIIRLLMDDWVKKFQKDGRACPPRKHERAFSERLPKTSSVLFEHPVAGNGRVLLKVDDLEGTSVERDVFPKWFVDHALNEAPEPESPKLSFVLSPGEDSNLPEISPSGVSAPKILGAKKIREFIAKKLSELANPPTVPEGSIRLSCAGVDVLGGDASKEDQTLASIHASVWKKSSPIVIEYTHPS